jgi:hypothetical protein
MGSLLNAGDWLKVLLRTRPYPYFRVSSIYYFVPIGLFPFSGLPPAFQIIGLNPSMRCAKRILSQSYQACQPVSEATEATGLAKNY